MTEYYTIIKIMLQIDQNFGKYFETKKNKIK